MWRRTGKEKATCRVSDGVAWSSHAWQLGATQEPTKTAADIGDARGNGRVCRTGRATPKGRPAYDPAYHGASQILSASAVGSVPIVRGTHAARSPTPDERNPDRCVRAPTSPAPRRRRCITDIQARPVWAGEKSSLKDTTAAHRSAHAASIASSCRNDPTGTHAFHMAPRQMRDRGVDADHDVEIVDQRRRIDEIPHRFPRIGEFHPGRRLLALRRRRAGLQADKPHPRHRRQRRERGQLAHALRHADPPAVNPCSQGLA